MVDKHLEMHSDSITEEVYLFSNDTLKDIATMAPKEEKPKKCFSRKKQTPSHYKE